MVGAWAASAEPPPNYQAGSQGPAEADSLLRPGDQWRAV
jgi:glucose-6-phosphate 1-dehydrogenase